MRRPVSHRVAPPATTARSRSMPLAALALLLVGACVGAMPAAQGVADAPLAARIIDALQPDSGEYAILRYDPGEMPGLANMLELMLRDRGVRGALLPYGAVRDFAGYLDSASIYVWLPTGDPAGTTAEQARLLAEWLDAGRGRQVHFHWGAGTVAHDGLPGEHSAAYAAVYRAALRPDYATLDRRQTAAIALLRSGPIHVTTPAGTDLRFEVGDRPFNKQNGDASRARMAAARIRIDREIELPAGVIRVAPIESSVNGTLVVPEARLGDGRVEELRIAFREGRATEIRAGRGEQLVRRELERQPALRNFRELGVGFNPLLVAPPDSTWLPYFGYGAGIIRLSLGNNEELGGAVRGAGVRWFFFSDATVRVGATSLVEQGRLCTELLDNPGGTSCTR